MKALQHHFYHYYKTIFKGKSMPFAFIDLDFFDLNIKQVIERSAGKNIRVASKSVRSVASRPLNYLLYV